MNPELARTLERLRQSPLARGNAPRVATSDTASTAASADPRTTAGARVFDTQTGEEGIVLGRTAENIIVPTTK